MSRSFALLSTATARVWILAGCGLLLSQSTQAINPGNYDRLVQETVQTVRSKLQSHLERYCYDSCQLLDVHVEVEEELANGEDMGFETVIGEEVANRLYVDKINVDIQIDDRVSSINRERLGTILRNHIRSLAVTTDIRWLPIQIPRIGASGDMDDSLREKVQRQLTSSVKEVIEQYCPYTCTLERVEVLGAMISPDEARDLPSDRVTKDVSGRSYFRISEAYIDVMMDELMPETKRGRIAALMRAKTRYVNPVNLNIAVAGFPETYAEKRERERLETEDPYGLEKLRRMLTMFRELAGTKEIITTSTESASTVSKNESSLLEKSQKANFSNVEKSGFDSLTMGEITVYIVCLLLVMGLILLGVIKFQRANRDAAEMVGARKSSDFEPLSFTGDSHEQLRTEGQEASDGAQRISLRLKVNDLKSELVQLFMENPRVAKETFSRFLKEDGVEETAKYVEVFGHMIIFELLNDPNFQRDLYQLSEYYHSSEFRFTSEEEFSLLQKLKTRATASEIRVLARKSSEKFDFLAKLDAGQIYKLVGDENVKVQSIVLTQLDRKKRMAVFDMYRGQAKVDLMSELCMAEAIPKEYMFNVAKALSRKVAGRPEFDTENLRTSDILLDLLEKADLSEQRNLMHNLQTKNTETARTVKMKLVTIELLPYLKDGHLLEIILGMEREDLLAFLLGTKEHIRDLLLRKAPEELADSWLEDLQVMAGIDEQNYRVAEMKVLNRIRNMANNGVINLLDINEIIFGDSQPMSSIDSSDTEQPLSQSGMVA